MLKKQITSLFFSLLLSSSLMCASAATPENKSASRPVRIAKSTLSLMGHMGLAACSGAVFYIGTVISSDSKDGVNPLAIVGLVSGGYGLWGGAKGMLCSIKKLADIWHEKSGDQAQKNTGVQACCSGHGMAD